MTSDRAGRYRRSLVVSDWPDSKPYRISCTNIFSDPFGTRDSINPKKVPKNRVRRLAVRADSDAMPYIIESRSLPLDSTGRSLCIVRQAGKSARVYRKASIDIRLNKAATREMSSSIAAIR